MKYRFLIVFVLFACILPSAIYGQQYQRGILLELYTGQGCPSCPLGSAALKEVVKGHEDDERLIWISHHAGYYPDSLTIKASTQLVSFYGVSGAPSLIYNRSLLRISGKAKLVQSATTFSSYNEVYRTHDAEGRSFVEAEMGQPADISVNMNVRYDQNSRNLTLTVFGEKNSNLTASAPALTVFFVQKKWIGSQTMGADYPGGTMPDYEHTNPVLHMLNEYYLGDLIEFDADGKYSKTFEYTVPEFFANYSVGNPAGNVMHKFDPENTYIVAIVSNRDESPVDNINYDRGNANVLNAVKAPFRDYETAVSEVVADKYDCNIYYSEGMIYVDGAYDEMSVYNLSGQIVENRGLERGIYIVKVVSNGNIHSEKIIVQ